MSTQARSDIAHDIERFTTQMADFPGFNAEGFRALIADTSEQAALKVLARYRTTLEAGLAELEAAAAARNTEALWKTAHKLAGTSELLGFDRFGNASKNFSHELRDAPDLSKHQAALDTYLADCRSVAGRLRAFAWLDGYT